MVVPNKKGANTKNGRTKTKAHQAALDGQSSGSSRELFHVPPPGRVFIKAHRNSASNLSVVEDPPRSNEARDEGSCSSDEKKAPILTFYADGSLHDTFLCSLPSKFLDFFIREHRKYILGEPHAFDVTVEFIILDNLPNAKRASFQEELDISCEQESTDVN